MTRQWRRCTCAATFVRTVRFCLYETYLQGSLNFWEVKYGRSANLSEGSGWGSMRSGLLYWKYLFVRPRSPIIVRKSKSEGFVQLCCELYSLHGANCLNLPLAHCVRCLIMFDSMLLIWISCSRNLAVSGCPLVMIFVEVWLSSIACEDLDMSWTSFSNVGLTLRPSNVLLFEM